MYLFLLKITTPLRRVFGGTNNRWAPDAGGNWWILRKRRRRYTTLCKIILKHGRGVQTFHCPIVIIVKAEVSGIEMPRHDFSATTNNTNYPNRTTAQSEWPHSANESFES